jgi:hypothetical protein
MLRESIDDWNTHLRDTFVFITDTNSTDNGLLPVKVSEVLRKAEVDEDEIALADVRIQGSVWEKKEDGSVETSGRNRTIELGDRYDIDMGFPTLGMANCCNYVAYACYAPNRQWKKSLNHRVVELTSPVLAEMVQRGMGRMILTGSLVHNILNASYTPIEDAIATIYDGTNMARAIGQYFAVVAKEGAKAPLVVYKNHAMGWVSRDGRIRVPQEVAYLVDELLISTDVTEDRIHYE